MRQEQFITLVMTSLHRKFIEFDPFRRPLITAQFPEGDFTTINIDFGGRISKYKVNHTEGQHSTDGIRVKLAKDIAEHIFGTIELIKPTDRCFPFETALNLLKQGKKLRRKGWNGKGIFIKLQRPDEHSKMTGPYIYIDTTGLQTDNPDAPRKCVPWIASQTDLLVDDWMIVD
jgi:hypothetical protein